MRPHKLIIRPDRIGFHAEVFMGTSKNRFEKGKWVEGCRSTPPALRATSPTGEDTPNARKADDVRLYALLGGLTKQAVCSAHFPSNEVFRGDL